MTTATLADFLHSNTTPNQFAQGWMMNGQPVTDANAAMFGASLDNPAWTKNPAPTGGPGQFDKNTMNLSTYLAGRDPQTVLNQLGIPGVTYNPATGMVNYSSDAENSGGGLSGMLNSPTAPLVLGTALLGGVGAFSDLASSLGLGQSSAPLDLSTTDISSVGNAAGGSAGATTGATGAAGAGTTFPVGSYNPADPLGLGTSAGGGVSATNMTGITPGDFTVSQLPGGSLSGVGAGTGVVDLGGAGAVPGVSNGAGSLVDSVLGNAGIPTPPAGTGGSTTPSGTTGTTPTGTTTAGAGTALSRILNGTGTTADWLSMLGTAGSTALGLYGANQQASALTDIANQARADRQPFLNASLGWLNDPASYAAGPGKSALDATLRALSVQGNPFGSPTSLAIAGDIANKNWQNAVTGFGNLGLAGQDSRNQLLAGAANAQSGGLDALGYGLSQITNPQPSLTDLLRQLRGTGQGSLT